MAKQPRLFCATDKEIYDVIMSAKLKLTESVLLELAKDRGIFYSSLDSRVVLANNISLLPHDFHDINTLLGQRDYAGRSEKTTSMVLNTPLTVEDIREISREFQEVSPEDEKVIHYQAEPNKYVVQINYSEIDYSKTRLVQRRSKSADIDFIIDGDSTIIRMPANPKAKDIANDLKRRLDNRKKTDIQAEMIELAEFKNAETRTQFFTSLITKLTGFRLHDVSSIKVESSRSNISEEEPDLEQSEELEQAQEEMLAVVKNVALKGKSLLSATEYQQLRERGFYITWIVWRSEQTTSDYPIVEFEAGFDQPEEGKGFKYNIKGALHRLDGNTYTKTLRNIEPQRNQELLKLLEQTAHVTIQKLRQDTGTPGLEENTNGDKE
jgi:hypothetical protein